ncbi:MAG: hypothetical protein VKK05_09420, partial [Synechococcus sp.]|nr:hypothetical protein [Synechococcus sp.]
YFDGLNTVNRRSLVTVEIFKIQFPIASQLDIISDKFLSLQLDGVALYDVTREADGGFFKITRETPYLLIADKELVTEGDTFIVSFYGEAPTDYVITGTESADIGGAPLTGTFTASGEQLTFTATVTGQKDFVLSLDNGKSSVGVHLVKIVNSLSVAPSTVNQNQSFVVTFNTNYNWSYGYTITGVTSADINGLPLTGTFSNDGDTLTLTATNAIDKALTLALNDGSDLINVTFDYIPQLYQLTSDLSFIVEGNTFTITFTTDDQDSASFPYPLTGVTSADIDGAPLTGTFTASGEQLTFTANFTTSKNFVLSLNNGKASVGVRFRELVGYLVVAKITVTWRDIGTSGNIVLNTRRGDVSSVIPFAPTAGIPGTTWSEVPSGFSYWGFQYGLVTDGISTVNIGLDNVSNSSTPPQNLEDEVNGTDPFSATVPVPDKEAFTDAVEILSVTPVYQN